MLSATPALTPKVRGVPFPHPVLHAAAWDCWARWDKKEPGFPRWPWTTHLKPYVREIAILFKPLLLWGPCYL